MTVKTIFVYYNDNKKYFLNWDSDVDVVKTPLANDKYNRIFYTENGVLRVTDKDLLPLDPNNALTVDPLYSLLPCPPVPTLNPEASGTAYGVDETLKETRGYVYTFVNKYGQEGPPSEVSDLIDIYDGNNVTVGNMDTSVDSSYAVDTKRIYRINQSAGENGQFQFVAEINLTQPTYEDFIFDSGLGEIIPDSWEAAPTGINGLISLPNQVLAGFIGNIVCFSYPKYPHAWPVVYQKILDKNVVGLGSYGTTVIALTEGQPYVIVGDNPASSVAEKIEIGHSCVSKKGIVDINGITVYPGPEGLVGIGSKGSDLLTYELMTQKQWSEYNPSSIEAYYWENKYVAFYSTLDKKAGFIFDPKTKDFIDLDRQNDTYSFFYATAGYHDQIDGTLYLQFGDEIDAFNKGISYRWMQYKSKRYKTKPWCPGVIKVIAKTYPVLIDIIYPEIPVTIVASVTSENPLRIPPFFVDTVEIRPYGNTEITAIYLASTFEELPI